MVDDGPLIDPDRFKDMREFWRCGITNFGAGCRVHWGCIELADVWRANAGRFNGADVVTWIDEERNGTESVLRGGMAGGGPRCVVLVREPCDWSLGGICGTLLFDGSDNDIDVVVVTFEVMLEVRCRIDDVTFDMDCEIELCAVWGWTDATVVIGFCGWTFTFGWCLICDWAIFNGTLPGVGCAGFGCTAAIILFISKMKT